MKETDEVENATSILINPCRLTFQPPYDAYLPVFAGGGRERLGERRKEGEVNNM